MSFARIERLLSEGRDEFIPVPRMVIKDIKEDALSKRLRGFDNAQIVIPLSNQSGVYINTNEGGVNEISDLLAKKPAILQPFHLGFSGWHNFDIIAQRCSARSLICDFNPENALFLHHVLFTVRACSDRFEFIKRITLFIKDNKYEGLRTTDNRVLHDAITPLSIKFSINVSDDPIYSDHCKVIEEPELELQRKSSWLYSDERYAHIRKMALEDKIALITENICAFEQYNKIFCLLNDNMIQIDTVYVSNISEWMDTEEDRESFFKTLQSLLRAPETILIDGRLRSPALSPTQRLITSRELNQFNVNKWFYCNALESENKDVEPDELLPCLDNLSLKPII